jgi:hypothetical protein
MIESIGIKKEIAATREEIVNYVYGMTAFISEEGVVIQNKAGITLRIFNYNFLNRWFRWFFCDNDTAKYLSIFISIKDGSVDFSVVPSNLSLSEDSYMHSIDASISITRRAR